MFLPLFDSTEHQILKTLGAATTPAQDSAADIVGRTCDERAAIITQSGAGELAGVDLCRNKVRQHGSIVSPAINLILDYIALTANVTGQMTTTGDGPKGEGSLLGAIKVKNSCIALLCSGC